MIETVNDGTHGHAIVPVPSSALHHITLPTFLAIRRIVPVEAPRVDQQPCVRVQPCQIVCDASSNVLICYLQQRRQEAITDDGQVITVLALLLLKEDLCSFR